jgi:hypothetical protein
MDSEKFSTEIRTLTLIVINDGVNTPGHANIQGTLYNIKLENAQVNRMKKLDSLAISVNCRPG